jgi:hypothetical protein
MSKFIEITALTNDSVKYKTLININSIQGVREIEENDSSVPDGARTGIVLQTGVAYTIETYEEIKKMILEADHG